MEDEVNIHKQRGRPFGYKLSEVTKEKIRQKRLGKHHSQETKDKISRSLIKYFLNKDKLSDSIEREYSYISNEAVKWVRDNKKSIDDSKYIVTDRRLSYFKQMELNMGSDIEYLFGHASTPEFLLMLKEEIMEKFGEEAANELCSLLL